VPVSSFHTRTRLVAKIVVRSVNHDKEVGETKRLYRKVFPHASTEFPYTRKVVLAFVDLGDADVIFYGSVPSPLCFICWQRSNGKRAGGGQACVSRLTIGLVGFSFIVHEYGDDCPEPNTKVC
jgi:hypothetical protein